MSIVVLCSHEIHDVCRCVCHLVQKDWERPCQCCWWCKDCLLNISKKAWFKPPSDTEPGDKLHE